MVMPQLLTLQDDLTGDEESLHLFQNYNKREFSNNCYHLSSVETLFLFAGVVESKVAVSESLGEYMRHTI